MSNVDRNRRVAMDYLSRLLDEAMEEGAVPQPSTFGIMGEDSEDEDPVYDWCQELIEVIDAHLFPDASPLPH